MTNAKLWSATALMLFGYLFLGACGTAEPMLATKTAAAPAGVDLSGNWQMREKQGARRRPQSDDTIRIPTRASRRTQPQAQGSSVHVFLEYGSALKVSQTPYSMFISYDRAIVEEYTFGENRLINVGPIEAKRVSGWDGRSFVVETLDREGATLYESWSLQSAEVLQRDVRIVEREEEVFSVQQLFDRK